MTFEEFLVFRDVEIKNSNHERIVRLFFGYAASGTGNKRLLPDLFGQLLYDELSKKLLTCYTQKKYKKKGSEF